MQAWRSALGLEPLGGLYQPLGGAEARPRGAVLRDADPGLAAFGTDRVDAEELEALLEACADAARTAVDEIRAGALDPSPESCAYTGGCAPPTIGRCVTAEARRCTTPTAGWSGVTACRSPRSRPTRPRAA